MAFLIWMFLLWYVGLILGQEWLEALQVEKAGRVMAPGCRASHLGNVAATMSAKATKPGGQAKRASQVVHYLLHHIMRHTMTSVLLLAHLILITWIR